MAMRMTATGLDEAAAMFEKLGTEAGRIAAQSLYQGAGVIADAMNKAVGDIRTEPFRYARAKDDKRLPSPEEKEALRNRSGIAHFRGSGSEIDTVIGFQNAGYTEIKGREKTYRKAVGQIANSINSGTSFMDKQPVFRRAMNTAKKAAQETIAKVANEEIEKLTK
jgi:HK97 gp10 family phage protein